MPTVTEPKTWAVGDPLPASDMNTYVRDNSLALLNAIMPSLTNKDGTTLTAGMVVVIDTSNNSAFKTTTTASDPNVYGVVQDASIANNAAGRIIVFGVTTVNVQGNVTRGNYLVTSTTAGRAKDGGSTSVGGAFARALDGYSGGGAGTVTASIGIELPPKVQYATGSITLAGGVGSNTISWPTAFSTVSGGVASVSGLNIGSAAITAISTTQVTVRITAGNGTDTVPFDVVGVCT